LAYRRSYCFSEKHLEERERINALRLRTSAAGQVVLDLFPGSYGVSVEGGPSGPVQHRFDVGLRPGPPVEIVLPSGSAVVYGRVLEHGSHRPIVGRPVFVWSQSGEHHRLGRAVTNQEGMFEIGGLAGGRVRLDFALQANAEGRLEVHTTEAGTPELASPFPSAYTEINLKSGERRQVNAIVPRVRGEGAAQKTVELSLSVIDEESSEPIAGARVIAEARFENLWVNAGDFETDASGAGSGLFLASDRYRIHIFGPRGGKGVEYRAKHREITIRGKRGTLDVELRRARDGD
jgi:hypothetical protein